MEPVAEFLPAIIVGHLPTEGEVPDGEIDALAGLLEERGIAGHGNVLRETPEPCAVTVQLEVGPFVLFGDAVNAVARGRHVAVVGGLPAGQEVRDAVHAPGLAPQYGIHPQVEAPCGVVVAGPVHGVRGERAVAEPTESVRSEGRACHVGAAWRLMAADDLDAVITQVWHEVHAPSTRPSAFSPHRSPGRRQGRLWLSPADCQLPTGGRKLPGDRSHLFAGLRRPTTGDRSGVTVSEAPGGRC